eukprot:TRINITY_DN1438_c0_g1_i10.p3 TRINITY_DN1438_c0_g1~~TRINITY_DN1438_c0_g1_i10.p3  ORF type:complete len:132 (-),score=30.83 TRINITY_DN1438_c0_g1_i10:359-754(-)
MLSEHFTDPFDEMGGDLLVPQETPIRQVYRSLGLYSRQNNPHDRSRLAPKVLRDESDSEVSQLEEAKNERILPLMSFRVHPSGPLRSLLNPAVLDVDRMTYEELLALGEFIGNVSKGLSKEQIAVFLLCFL